MAETSTILAQPSRAVAAHILGADQDVREEVAQYKRAASTCLQLTAWRGRSRRRRVFIIHDAADPALAEETEGVALAVRRHADGVSTRLDAVVIEQIDLFVIWLAGMRARGADEIHLLRSGTRADNLVIARDLGPVADEGAGRSDPRLRAA